MNKEKLKIIITIVILALVAGSLYMFSQQKKVQVEESIESPVEQNTESAQDVPSASIKKPAVKSENQTLFDKKMKEASGYFLKKDYTLAVVAYTQVLNIINSEYAYAGLYSANLALKDYTNAEKAILSAIKINPEGSDYWSWYLVLLQDAMKAPRTKLDAVYNDALNNVLDNKKINIITAYARIFENLGDKSGAIAQWQKAITLNPGMQSVYQAEIEILKGSN
jgi:tetratricopeptide (TPR) repeat protein